MRSFGRLCCRFLICLQFIIKAESLPVKDGRQSAELENGGVVTIASALLILTTAFSFVIMGVCCKKMKKLCCEEDEKDATKAPESPKTGQSGGRNYPGPPTTELGTIDSVDGGGGGTNRISGSVQSSHVDESQVEEQGDQDEKDDDKEEDDSPVEKKSPMKNSRFAMKEAFSEMEASRADVRTNDLFNAAQFSDVYSQSQYFKDKGGHSKVTETNVSKTMGNYDRFEPTQAYPSHMELRSNYKPVRDDARRKSKQSRKGTRTADGMDNTQYSTVHSGIESTKPRDNMSRSYM